MSISRIPRRFGKLSLKTKALYSTWSSYPTMRKQRLRQRLNSIRDGWWNTPLRDRILFAKAWKEGLKGLYYLRTTAGVTAEKVGTSVDRNALKDFEGEECVSCQG
jgi:hypothetical protein